MPTKISVQPAEEPVSLAEAKAWLKVDYSTDDDLLTSLIEAARIVVEDYTNIKLISQTIEETYECFPASSHGNRYGALVLTYAPLVSVSSVQYQATAGTYTTWDSANYTVHTYEKPASITPVYDGVWPTVIKYPESVKVTYVAGLAAAAASVPEVFKTAIKKLVAQWYENRAENVRRMPTDVEWMLNVQRLIYW
jgi:uncharacterized phiE125 gp8 family phage protein